jgi:hypothetical protein
MRLPGFFVDVKPAQPRFDTSQDRSLNQKCNMTRSPGVGAHPAVLQNSRAPVVCFPLAMTLSGHAYVEDTYVRGMRSHWEVSSIRGWVSPSVMSSLLFSKAFSFAVC